MGKVKFDVGANQGVDTVKLAEDGSTVYAFEPTRFLVSNHLWPKAKENPNIIVIPMAVDIENGFKNFNLAEYWDWGCSSLHATADNIDDVWKEHFKVTSSYIVPTITLYDFCELYKIDLIDYLWIDTQGSDLNVLKSLGNKINSVVEGRCEASNKASLYQVDYSLNSIANFLYENNFEITKIEYNDKEGYEVNVFFRNKFFL